MKRPLIIAALILGAGYALIVLLYATNQRRMLYFPSHNSSTGQLTPWFKDGGIVGCYREKKNPPAIWLMTHGNGGQASDREYALHCFPPADSVYVLEYPGFGLRAGQPTKESMNRAAEEMYRDLRARFPGKKIGVVGESIGSGPACHLGSLPNPPDKLVLVVPFETLVDVAFDHVPFLPVSLILKDDWDNLAALRTYPGPIEIFGAADDRLIEVSHAKRLAAGLPRARFHLISGGHNDWSRGTEVSFQMD